MVTTLATPQGTPVTGTQGIQGTQALTRTAGTTHHIPPAPTVMDMDTIKS